MRISDWSSDVCSSDLHEALRDAGVQHPASNGLDRSGLAECSGSQHDHCEQRQIFERIQMGMFGARHQPRACDRIAATPAVGGFAAQNFDHARSEEHTSELQSLMRISYAGFCLQKKYTKQLHDTTDTQTKQLIL